MSCELKRMLQGRGFWAAMVLAGAGLLLGTSFPDMKEVLEAGSFFSILQKALGSKTVQFLLPVAAVLPYSDSFLEEWKGGFLKFILLKKSRRFYVGGKVFAVAAGGFLTWAFAAVWILFFYFLLFFPLEVRGGFPIKAFGEFFLQLLRLCLVGGTLASLGGIFGTAFGSVYMAYGLPFVGYYLLIILHERYLKDLLWIYPPEWLSATAWWGEGGMGLWLFLLLMLGVAMGIHGGVLYERVGEI